MVENEDESRYQKKSKSKKNNGVCRENEKDLEESRSNIKKGTRRDEITGKQKKERNQRMEEER